MSMSLDVSMCRGQRRIARDEKSKKVVTDSSRMKGCLKESTLKDEQTKECIWKKEQDERIKTESHLGVVSHSEERKQSISNQSCTKVEEKRKKKERRRERRAVKKRDKQPRTQE